MIEQPTRCEDIAAHDQRHRRIKPFQRYRQAQIFGEFERATDLPQARLYHRIEARFLRPGGDGAAQQRVARLVPVCGFGGRERERGRRPVRPAREDDAGAGRRGPACALFGRGLDGLAGEPGTDLVPLPAFAAVTREQTSQQQIQRWIEALGNGTPLVRTWIRKA